MVMRGRLVNLRVIRKRLNRILALSEKLTIMPFVAAAYDEDEVASHLPEDVKEGHFVVHTVNGEVTKRFIIELSCLGHPEFLKLLEQAKEEFGFKREGVLAVHCQPGELRKILDSMNSRVNIDLK